MPQTLTGVVYDVHTLAPRSVIAPHDDSHLTNGTFKLLPGEAMAIVPNTFVAGMNVTALAIFAITRRTGRAPPPMDQVHAMDALSIGMNGGKLRVY